MRVEFEFCESCEYDILSGNPAWGETRHPELTPIKGLCSCCYEKADENSTIPMEATIRTNGPHTYYTLR